MAEQLLFKATETVAVGTTVLRVFGASSWTSVTALANADLWVNVANCHATNTVYLALNTVATETVGAVSSTDFDVKLAAGANVNVHVPPNCNLFVLSSGAGSNVRATSLLVVGQA